VKLSFRAKTILGIAAIEAVMLLVLVWAGLAYMRAATEQEVVRHAATAAQMFAATTQEAVLATDLAVLDTVVREVARNPAVRYARVRGRGGRVLVEYGDAALLARRPDVDRRFADVRDDVFDAAADITVAGTSYGRVELGISVAMIHAALARAGEGGTAIALAEMLLVALFSLALGTYLTKQLEALRNGARRLAEGGLGHQVEVRGEDELAETARAFNSMSARLARVYGELRERGERLAEAQRIARLGHWDWDVVQNTLAWSDEVYRIFGLQPQESAASYEAFLERVHPDDREYVKAEVNAALARERPYSIDHRVLYPDGTLRVVHERAEISFDAQGRPLRMLGTVQDVTEQRENARALRVGEQRLALALESADLGLWDVSLPSGETYVNEQALRLLEREGGEPCLSVSQWEAMLHPEDRARVLKAFADSIEGRAAAFDAEYRVRTGGGEWKWIHHRGRVVERDAAGQPRRSVGVFRDISQYVRARDELRRLAHHDVLTDLPNRTLFLDRFAHALAQARRNDTGLALLFVDLDRFKEVNDRYGHHVGDEVLREIAQRLARCVRASDTVARLGGDEFAVLLGELRSREAAEAVARKICLACLQPVVRAGEKIVVGASIGISLYPADGLEEATLIRNADGAMYRAKHLGRGRYGFHDGETSDASCGGNAD
jgi:diguanylate cyclase (GGDEF)-like protein/PAS domain S-box-containing protein